MNWHSMYDVGTQLSSGLFGRKGGNLTLQSGGQAAFGFSETRI
jgi:hypothetical protein